MVMAVLLMCAVLGSACDESKTAVPFTPVITTHSATSTTSLVPRVQGTVIANWPTSELSIPSEEALSTVQIVKVLRPSVVHIGTRSMAIAMATDDMPDGVGTGVILDDTGHILTNNHVVEGAQQIVVTLHSDESFLAEIVGRDPQTDTAVIRIDAAGLIPARFGISSELGVGEDVIAIGHALGLSGGPTVSKGVVSALNRSLPNPQTQITMVDMIQTDASINPGNSGGPLVNNRAEVIGINSAIIRDVEGIGFAISIDGAKVVTAQLIEYGLVRRGYMGVQPFNITAAIAAQNNLPVKQGIYLAKVTRGEAADDSGLQDADILIRMNDDPVANTGDVFKFLIDNPPGTTIMVEFLRGDERMTTQVTLGERP